MIYITISNTLIQEEAIHYSWIFLSARSKKDKEISLKKKARVKDILELRCSSTEHLPSTCVKNKKKE
jgi:hypothetical protein